MKEFFSNYGMYVYIAIGVILAIISIVMLVKLCSKKEAKNTSSEVETKAVATDEVKAESKKEVAPTAEEKPAKKPATKKPATKKPATKKVAEEKAETTESEESKVVVDKISVKETKVSDSEEETDFDEDIVVESHTEGQESTTKRVERYRIVHDKVTKEWIIKKDGGKRATKRCSTKKEALEYAKNLSEKHNIALAVHKKDGKFQKR